MNVVNKCARISSKSFVGGERREAYLREQDLAKGRHSGGDLHFARDKAKSEAFSSSGYSWLIRRVI